MDYNDQNVVLVSVPGNFSQVDGGDGEGGEKRISENRRIIKHWYKRNDGYITFIEPDDQKYNI